MSFDVKTVELIAIGASVAANCHPCIQTHVNKGLKAGLTEEEIKEAIEVGRTVRSGAANSMDKLVSNPAELIANPAKSSGKCC
ncbi:AhpD family alkylhydroperoxidase [Desulfitobacterium sp. LBE]|uniref:Alkylhydroperoxidase AhpD family core domain protein n=2 Tax=root TaxID=1 RepID=H5Y2G9_9FIRM|nr:MULTISPECIES: carboxymuconolactone decarboxylase family protein [Desulfitobacteriaceae]EHQ88660.1 alkylhydroperoxidase AhpD family core domain protein [Desulfosporosinus youngiae DSM 17734]MEA5022199.1 carboxymuconolactone decarboxylase family protein [Desulfitobacterium hafniense]TWH59530.1 AhpD family alkylhydroperoxidase [Desulfitobacterium sp. LBE]